MENFDDLKSRLSDAQQCISKIDELNIERTNPALSELDIAKIDAQIGQHNNELDEISTEISDFLFGEAFSCIFEDEEAIRDLAKECRTDSGDLDIKKFVQEIENKAEPDDKVTIDNQRPVDTGGPTIDIDDYTDGPTEKEGVVKATLRDSVCGGDGESASRIYSDLSKAYKGNTAKIEAAANFAQACNPASIKASSKEEVLWRKVNYDTAKEQYDTTRGKYNFRNTFSSIDKLSFNISAYKSGLPGANGTTVTGGDIAMNVIELLRGNIFESLFEIGLKKFIDKVSPPREAQVDIKGDQLDQQPSNDHKGDRPIDVSSSPEVDFSSRSDWPEPKEKEDAFRENGSVNPKATKEEIDAAAKSIDRNNPAGGSFCGADMRVEPKVWSGISTWDTGKPIDKLTTVIDGKIESYRIPAMRVADVAGNRYLVDPFGRATAIEVRSLSTQLSVDESGTSYIKPLDRSLSRADAPKIEALANTSEKSVADIKQDLSDRAVTAYIKDAGGRIEAHKGFLEGKVSEQKDCVEGYKEQIYKLESAIDRAQDKISALDQNNPAFADKKNELEAKIKDYESSAGKLEKAIDSAEANISKYEGAIERYSKALKDISSDMSPQEKLSSVVDAEIKSIGRADTTDSNMTAEDIEFVKDSLESAQEIDDTDDVATQENEMVAVDTPEIKADNTEDVDGTENVTANEKQPDPVVVEESQGNKVDSGNIEKSDAPEASVESKSLDVNDVLTEKMQAVEAADAKIQTIREEKLPEIDAKIEAAKTNLEANIEARDEYAANGVDYGEGVAEALDASVESSRDDLAALEGERNDLCSQLEEFETESADANSVIEFIQTGFEDGAEIELNDDGNLVKTIVDEDGEVTKETMSLETGEVKVSTDTEDDDADVVADAVDTQKERNEEIQEDVQKEDPAVAADSQIDVLAEGSTNEIDKEDIKEAMSKYIDQEPDGDFSFSDDFLASASEEIPYEVLLDALNEVIEERQDNNEESPDNENRFSDLLGDIIDYTGSSQLQDVVDLINDIIADNWETVGTDLLELAIDNSSVSFLKEDIMDLFIRDDTDSDSTYEQFDVDGGLTNGDMPFSGEIEQDMTQVDTDFEAYDTYADIAAQTTAADFADMSDGPDQADADPVSMETDSLVDFSQADLATDFGAELIESSGAEAAVDSAVEEILAALI